MVNERFGIQVDTAYVESLGRATFVFAYLEFGAISCCERMTPMYVHSVARKMAGTIARDFVRYAASRGDPEIEAAAREFARLVCIRNNLLHAGPATAANGDQHLFRNGQEWTATMIDDAADEFGACAKVLNTLLYGQLKLP
jgi:hypothetical protein